MTRPTAQIDFNDLNLLGTLSLMVIAVVRFAKPPFVATLGGAAAGGHQARHRPQDGGSHVVGKESATREP